MENDTLTITQADTAAQTDADTVIDDELLVEEISIDGMCGVSDPVLDQALELHPQVALRPEPFGALAYHYGNRRLVFLKHPDMVAVARRLAEHESLSATLEACAIAPARWSSFATAFASLKSSEIVRER